MTPAGYMAKHVYRKSDWIKACKNRVFLEGAPQVIDVYSASNCLSKNFADYVPYWKHNGYWLFDSPEAIESVCKENSIGLEGTSLFYYEAHEMEFDEGHWRLWSPDPSFPTNVAAAARSSLKDLTLLRSTPEAHRNALPFRVTRWRRKSARTLIACSSLLTKLRRVSTTVYLRMLSPDLVEYSRCIP